MPDYYIHRPDVIQVNLYISPDFSPSPDCLLVFSDPVSLEAFSDRLRHSGTNFRWQSVVQHLGGQIIEDSLGFLTDIANEIHKAVGT